MIKKQVVQMLLAVLAVDSTEVQRYLRKSVSPNIVIRHHFCSTVLFPS